MVRRNYNNNKLDLEDGLIVSKDISLREQSTAPLPEVGIGKIYAKNDGKIYFLDSSGNEDSFALGSSAGDVTSSGNNIFTGQNTFSNKVIFDGNASSLNSPLIDFTGTAASGHALLRISPATGGQALNITSSASSNNVVVVKNTASTGGGIQVESSNSSTSSGAGGALTARNDAGGIGLVVKSGLSRFDAAAEFNSTVTLSSDPVNPLQAATKQYVDTAVSGAGGSSYLADSGSGNLNTAPTVNNSVDAIAIGESAIVGTGSDNSYAIGSSASVGSNALRSISFGYGAATSTNDSISIGSLAETSTNDRALSIGTSNYTGSGIAKTLASGLQSICIGAASATSTGSSIVQSTGEGSICIGTIKNENTANKTVQSTNTGSICIGSRVSSSLAGNGPSATGINSIVIGSINGSGAAASATNSNSMAIGSGGTTTGTGPASSGFGSIAIGSGGSGKGGNGAGSGPVASGDASIAIGSQAAGGSGATASGVESIAIGGGDGVNGPSATGQRSIALGTQSVADKYGMMVRSAGRFSNFGDCQWAQYILRRITTDGTQNELTGDGSTPSSSNRMIIPSGGLWTFTIKAQGTDGTDAISGVYHGTIQNVGGTTALVGSLTTMHSANTTGAASWNISIQANDANDNLEILVTGEISKTIKWNALIDMIQVF